MEDDLSMFSKLQILKAGENLLPLARLGVIPNLRKLTCPCNGVTSFDLDLDGRFTALEVRDFITAARKIKLNIDDNSIWTSLITLWMIQLY